jgi:hypothetical protein
VIQLYGKLFIFASFKLQEGERSRPDKAAFFYATDFKELSTAAPRGVWDNHPKVLPLVNLNSA